MSSDSPSEQDFSDWTGELFFEGEPRKGRHVYIVKTDKPKGFKAVGMMDGSRREVFRLRGAEVDFKCFLVEMNVEHARVTFGTPPYDTNTGGDKSGSSTTKPGRK